MQDLTSIYSQIQASKLYALDTETTGLYWNKNDSLFCASLAWEYPKGKINSKFVSTQEEFAFLRRLLNSDVLVVGHNICFDLHFIKKYLDAVPKRFIDSMVIAHLYDSRDRKGLLPLSIKYLGYDGKYDQILKDYKKKHRIKGDYSQIPIDIIKPYALNDAECSLKLYLLLGPLVMNTQAYKIDAAMLPLLFDMEERGVTVDLDYLNTIHRHLVNGISFIDRKVESVCPGLNILSNKQLREYFLSHNITLKKKTPTGQYSTDAEVLRGIDDPVARLSMKKNDLVKLNSTYIENLMDADIDGAVRPKWNLTGTLTGRLSCTDPPLQTIPTGRITNMIRKAFVANKCLGFFDYEQLEYIIFAYYCNDKSVIDKIKSGIDFHTLVACSIFDISPEEVRDYCTKLDLVTRDTYRGVAKGVNFGVLYGMTVYRLAKILQTSLDNALIIWNKYLELFPAMMKYKESLEKNASDVGYVKTIFDRKIPIDSDRLYVATNYLCQSTAADVAKIGLLRANKILKKYDSYPILFIHDEFVFDNFPQENMKGVVSEVIESCSSIPILEKYFPMKFSYSTTNWGDTHELG